MSALDDETGLVLKRIETTLGDYNNRKIAVNNSFYNAEKDRLLFSKPVLTSPVQTKHIHYNPAREAWNFSLINDTIEEAQEHADKQGRIFIAYPQLNELDWDSLSWKYSEALSLKMARRGVAVVPYFIPLNASYADWQPKKKDIEKMLNHSQELMPVLCSKHDTSRFGGIINKMFPETKLLGIHCYSPVGKSILNYSALFQNTIRATLNSEVPCTIGFCPNRYIRSLSNVSSAYYYSQFGIDIISYRVISPQQAAKIEDASPEEFKYYDSIEGGYSLTENQIVWYGTDLTRAQLSRISADEGLAPYDAHRWVDFLKESDDLDILNNDILGSATMQRIEHKSRWYAARQLLRND